MLNNKSIAVQSLAAFFIKILSGVSGYVLFSLISRFSDSQTFGSFSILFSLAMFLGILGSFGQQIFIVKNTAIARNKSSKETEKGIYIYSSLATIAGCIVCSIIFSVTAFYFAEINSTPQLIFGSAITFMFGITQTTTGFYRIEERTLYAILTREFLWRVTSIGLAVSAYIYTSTTLTLTLALSAVCLAFVPTTLIHVKHVISKLKEFHDLRPSIEIKSWLETSSGLALIAAISSADLYLFTILLNNNAPPKEIGAFFAASKTVELINMFLMAVTLIASTEISRLVAKKDHIELQRQCNSTLLIQAIPSLVCCIAVISLSPWILSVFDPVYRDYSAVLSLLCIGMIINSLTGSTVLLLQLGNMHWQHVLYQGGSLLISLAMLPILTSNFGINGAAIAFILSKTIWNMLAIIAIRKNLKVDPSLFGLFSNGLTSLASAFDDVLAQVGKRVSRAK